MYRYRTQTQFRTIYLYTKINKNTVPVLFCTIQYFECSVVHIIVMVEDNSLGTLGIVQYGTGENAGSSDNDCIVLLYFAYNINLVCGGSIQKVPSSRVRHTLWRSSAA